MMKVEKIVLRIGDVTVEITREEAEELKEILDILLKTPPHAPEFPEVTEAKYTSLTLEERLPFLVHLLQWCNVRSTEQVGEYLSKHPAMLDVLNAACVAIRRRLPRSEIVVDWYVDPEIDDQYLVLIVRPEEYNDETLDVLKKVEREIIPLMQSTDEWLQITTDFQDKEE